MRQLPFVFLALLAPALAFAQTPAPFPDFTFKRVSPPQPGDGPRINVQIAPAPQPAPVLPGPTAVAPGADPDVAAFWSAIGPEIASASPGRLDAARALVRGARFGAPTLQTMQGLAAAHGRTVLAQSIETRVSPALALAVIAVESSGRPEAISSAGAQGLMQLMPATAARFDVSDVFDPAQNIAGGMAYLRVLLNQFGGDAILALAAYNAGENAVLRAGGVPEFPETRSYVPKVVAAWDVARSLCLTPPDLPSDGCVFANIAAN